MKTLHRLHFALLFALIACCASHVVAAQKPNIILVMPDDAGYGDYASLGNPIMRTPSVDAFKKESLLSLLKNPKAEWADRTLVHHVGRWAHGKAAESKYAKSAIQNSRFTLVHNAELYDLKADPGEMKNVIAEHPDVVAKLSAAYDQWWTDVQPLLVNENVTGIPKINPLKELYWKQFGGGPDEAMLRKLDPTKGAAGEANGNPNKQPERKKRKAGKAEEAK